MRARSLERTTTDHFPPRLRSCEAPESRRSRNRPNTLGPGREVDRERRLLHPRNTGRLVRSGASHERFCSRRNPAVSNIATRALGARDDLNGSRQRGLARRRIQGGRGSVQKLGNAYVGRPVTDDRRPPPGAAAATLGLGREEGSGVGSSAPDPDEHFADEAIARPGLTGAGDQSTSVRTW